MHRNKNGVLLSINNRSDNCALYGTKEVRLQYG